MQQGAGQPLITHVFEWVLRLGFALVPSIGIAYLVVFRSPQHVFVSHAFHEVAIALAVTLSAGVAYVTWLCYRHSGEPFLRWIALGLTGFTVVYLPHGALTGMADHNLALFLLFGPASRIVMAACLVIGLTQWGRDNDSTQTRASLASLWLGIAIFIGVDLLVAAIAIFHLISPSSARLIFEGGALALEIAGVAAIFAKRIDSPLMWLYTVALAAFAQSSLSFFLARPWDHQWWLAHLIFAAGFMVLSFGVVRAYHTTRAFATVYSQEELMRRLEDANQRLSHLAATDPLTGVANRRRFFERLEDERIRRARNEAPLSLLAIDIDHFKGINDRYGHVAGDLALKAVVERVRKSVRASDTIGRMGGEEFAVLCPGLELGQAGAMAERLREAVAADAVVDGGNRFSVTISVGVAELGADGNTDRLIRNADACLYQAKVGGRNRVVSG